MNVVDIKGISAERILVTVKSRHGTIYSQAVLTLDEARGLYANLGIAIDEVQPGEDRGTETRADREIPAR